MVSFLFSKMFLTDLDRPRVSAPVCADVGSDADEVWDWAQVAAAAAIRVGFLIRWLLGT